MRLPNRLVVGLLAFCVVLLIHTSRVPAEYVIEDIGTLGGTTSCAYAINNLGQVVGSAGTRDTDGQMRAFLYDQAGGIRKLDPNFNTIYSIPLDINDAGAATGYFNDAIPHAFSYTPGGGTVDLGVLGGAMTSYGEAINTSGELAGTSCTASSDARHAFRGSGSVLYDLGDLGGGYSYAHGINDSSPVAVVGHSRTANGNYQAFRWRLGGMTPLASLGSGTYSRAEAINNEGLIVGEASNGSQTHAVGWSANGTEVTDFGTLGGQYSRALSLNAAGDVVGFSYTLAGVENAFLYKNGVMTNLNSLLPAGSSWSYLKRAYDINDSGQIVGQGVILNQLHAFLMTPITPGDTDKDGDVDLVDLGKLATYYGTTSGANWGMGDFDKDGDVDLVDLGAMAANYGHGVPAPLNFAADAAKVGLSDTKNASADESSKEDNSEKVLPLPDGCSPIGIILIGGIMMAFSLLSSVRGNSLEQVGVWKCRRGRLLGASQTHEEGRAMRKLLSVTLIGVWLICATAGSAADQTTPLAADVQPTAVMQEMRGVWIGGFDCTANGAGCTSDWETACQAAAGANFNAIFPLMASGAVARYNSMILPLRDLDRGDQLTLCVAAARRHGLKVHVWQIVNYMEGSSEGFRTRIRDTNRQMTYFNGNPVDYWLCPSNPANVASYVETALEMVREYDIDGIHLDYIRYDDNWSNGWSCYCSGCRQRFEAYRGASVPSWPADCWGTGSLAAEYRLWRIEVINNIVRTISRECRKIKPNIKISAAVFGWSSLSNLQTRIAQDWPTWISQGWVDFVCPMNYVTSTSSFTSLVNAQKAWVTDDTRIYAGIGHYLFWDAGIPSPEVREAAHVQVTRDRAIGGFVLFPYNLDMINTSFPYLLANKTQNPAVPPH